MLSLEVQTKKNGEGESKHWRACLLFRQLVSPASGIKQEQHVKINEMLLLLIYSMQYINIYFFRNCKHSYSTQQRVQTQFVKFLKF